MPLTKKQNFLFLLGAILLLTGVTLWLYTNSIIQAHQQTLQNPNLTQQERWALEGSLQWWAAAKITLYDPIAVILTTIGLITLLYLTLYTITQPNKTTN